MYCIEMIQKQRCLLVFHGVAAYKALSLQGLYTSPVDNSVR